MTVVHYDGATDAIFVRIGVIRILGKTFFSKADYIVFKQAQTIDSFPGELSAARSDKAAFYASS